MIFKQAFRIAFVALIWKQYKAAIISTLLLFVYLFVVSSIHQDYLAAVGIEKVNKLSFIYKWLAFIVGFVVFFGFHMVRGRIKTKTLSTEQKIAESKDLTDSDDDPFAAIREREKLRSRADFLIDSDD